MKILKKSVKEYHAMQRKAIKNQSKGRNGNNHAQTKNDVYEVWNINDSGNVIFTGYLKAAETWYPEAPRAGFLVRWAAEPCLYTLDADVKDRVTDEIIEEITNIQNKYRKQ